MAPPTDVTERAQARMREVYDEYLGVAEQIVELDRWDIDDVECAPKDYLRAIQKLSGAGVIERAGTRMRGSHCGEGQDRIVVWQWRESCRNWLVAYVSQRNELPCRHRAHIHTAPDGRLDCRFCDEVQDFDRGEVMAVMPR